MSVVVTSAIASSATEESLVASLRAGDDAAFEELYRRYRPRVYGFVRRMVRDAARAEDVTQEVFLSALRRIRATDSAIAFKPWVFEIARNAAIDHFRRSSRTEEVSMDGESLRAADQLRLVGPGAPDSAVVAKEELDQLCGAFSELSETHERIIVLRELEGLSYREIGERMELTRPAVESTLFRARRRLEHEYEELETGRRCTVTRASMGRLAEGLGSARELKRVSRHAARCTVCARTAHELGLRLEAKPSLAARAAALLPFPLLTRRSFGSSGGGTAAGPSAELAAAGIVKAAALVAAVALLGGTGAVRGGGLPLISSPSKPKATQPTPGGPHGSADRRRGFVGADISRGRAADRGSDGDRPGSGPAASRPGAQRGAKAEGTLAPRTGNGSASSLVLPRLSAPPAPSAPGAPPPDVSLPSAPSAPSAPATPAMPEVGDPLRPATRLPEAPAPPAPPAT